MSNKSFFDIADAIIKDVVAQEEVNPTCRERLGVLENTAALIYDQVSKRTPSNKIVEMVVFSLTTKFISANKKNEMCELIDKYRSRRSGLENCTKQILTIIESECKDKTI
jgi:hypothetical protein